MNQFIRISMALSLILPASICFSSNPLNFGSNIRSADPSGHVWADGKMYLYCSHDEECQEDFFMKDWHVFSSSDLVNWTDHGAVLKISDLKWADNYAWAPDAAYKNGKYYFVFPAGTGMKYKDNPQANTKWMGVGVAESNSPTGPFTDPIGKPLWTNPYANDPCIFIDDDGKAFLYFHGGGDYKVFEMSDDMLSVKESEAYQMNMGDSVKRKMEGPWVFKRKDFYYFSMPEGNRVITYYMSKSPKGPWEYKGVIMEQENESNNHHSIVEYKGKWVIFYHRWLVRNNDPACPTKRQRHVCAEYLYFNDDGTIKEVKRTDNGVDFSKTNVTQEHSKDTRLSASININKNNISIKLPTSLHEHNTIASLYKLSGQKLCSVTDASRTLKLNTNNINHGVYILKIMSKMNNKESFSQQQAITIR